jgi:hypothetical protein
MIAIAMYWLGAHHTVTDQTITFIGTVSVWALWFGYFFVRISEQVWRPFVSEATLKRGRRMDFGIGAAVGAFGGAGIMVGILAMVSRVGK